MNLLSHLVVLHGGTSPVLSQTVLTFMFVALGILLVGIGFGYVVNNKETLHQLFLTRYSLQELLSQSAYIRLQPKM